MWSWAPRARSWSGRWPPSTCGPRRRDPWPAVVSSSTRPRAQAGALVAALADVGATVIELPLIAAVDPDDGGRSLRAGGGRGDHLRLGRLHVVERRRAFLPPPARRAGPRRRPLGRGGRRHGAGPSPPIVSWPTRPRRRDRRRPGGGDAVRTRGRGPAPTRALPRAAAARDVLAPGLRAKGWEVSRSTPTAPWPPTPRDGVGADELDAAARGRRDHLHVPLRRRPVRRARRATAPPPVVACIGPVTAEAAHRAGFHVDVVADEHSAEGLAAVLVAHFGAAGDVGTGGTVPAPPVGSRHGRGPRNRARCGVPGAPHAPSAPHRGAAPPGGRDHARGRRPGGAAVRAGGHRRARAHRVVARARPALTGIAVLEAKRLASLGVPGIILFGIPDSQGRRGVGAWDPDGIVQLALGRAARRARRHAWCSSPTSAWTSTPTTATAASLGADGRSTTTPPSRSTRVATAQAARRRRHGGAQRDDGRPGGRDPRRAGRGRAPRRGRARLRGQIRLGPVRALPRGRRRDHRRRRGPAGLPAGPPQRARGAGRGGARHRRGRRHGDGEARPRLPRRHRGGARRASTSPWPHITSAASTPW